MSNAQENKPREFWIDENGIEDHFEDPFTMDHVHLIHVSARNTGHEGFCHVIEHSAYARLQEANKKLREYLAKYACHTESCCCHIGHKNYEHSCDCGFDELLSEAAEIEGKNG